MTAHGFPYGASYSPLIFPEDQWAMDLDRMKEASMNLVRIGDVHGSWDRIEPRRGEFEFPKLKRFYETAERYGIQILLSTGANSPPLWLKTEYPDVSILSSRGERYPLGSSYHWACIHHPEYRQALENYTHHLANFASQFKNHFGWQISNEIGFPFLPAREEGELGLYCYCQHCQDRFRDWVKEKYHQLNSLTDAWSWGTTNFVYNDWDEVEGPESLPASWSGVTRWIDWRLFWQDAFTRFAAWQHQLIRTVDHDHPTSVNTFNFKGFDRFGTFMGLDQWKIAQEVNHIGYDLYPGSGDKRKTRPEHSSIFLDHGRSVAQSAGSDFWIHEVESGPIGGWLLGPDYATQPEDIANYIIESLGHDAKLIIYMPWREWAYQPLRWGALVTLQGEPTPRLEAASRMGEVISERNELLTASHALRGEVAIVESKPNAIFLRGVNQEELLFQAQRGAYRAFWDQGYSVDFITPSQLSDPKLSNYLCIILPMLGLLNKKYAKLLEEYVRRGGLVIGTSRLATQNDQGWTHENYPLENFQRMFGINTIEADTLANQKILFKNRSFSGALNRDLITVTENTEVLARFSDQAPAVVRATLGDGSGVYISTQADLAYLDHPGENLLLEIIQETIQSKPRLTVDGRFSRARGVDPHLLEGNGKSLVLFSNYLTEPQQGTLRFQLGDRLPVDIKRIYPDEQPIPYQVEDDCLSVPLDFTQKEVIILEITWGT